jgi:hypothetical protein
MKSAHSQYRRMKIPTPAETGIHGAKPGASKKKVALFANGEILRGLLPLGSGRPKFFGSPDTHVHRRGCCKRAGKERRPRNARRWFPQRLTRDCPGSEPGQFATIREHGVPVPDRGDSQTTRFVNLSFGENDAASRYFHAVAANLRHSSCKISESGQKKAAQNFVKD